MRISDWSSDVCSSDLVGQQGRVPGRLQVVDQLLHQGDELGLGLLLFDVAEDLLGIAHLVAVAQRPQHDALAARLQHHRRSEEHTSARQSLMRISYAVFCRKKKKQNSRLLKYRQNGAQS